MSAIDWTTRPPPWCYIGPAFVHEARNIAGQRRRVSADKLPDQNGAALTGARLRLKLNVSELAALCGLSHSMISRLEHGTGTASPDTWARIEAALAKAEAERQ